MHWRIYFHYLVFYLKESSYTKRARPREFNWSTETGLEGAPTATLTLLQVPYERRIQCTLRKPKSKTDLERAGKTVRLLFAQRHVCFIVDDAGLRRACSAWSKSGQLQRD